MASNLPKSINVFFNEVIKTFNNNNMTAKIVKKFKMPETTGEQGFNIVWKPIDDQSIGSTGRTVADALFTDVTALSVPSTLNTITAPASNSDFINSTFKLNANDLNDATSRSRKVLGVIRDISGQIDLKTTRLISQQGAIFIKPGTAITSYAQLSKAEAEMSKKGVPILSARTMMLDPDISNAVANDLQARQAPPTGVSLTALERSKLPPVAGFDTFKTNFLPRNRSAAALNSTKYKIKPAAGAFHIPKGNDGGVPNPKPVDNRTMVLDVDTGTGGAAVAGDAFTIANVNALNMETKESLGVLQTFRIVSSQGTGDTTWVITPALVAKTGTSQAEKEYANCDTKALENADITFINTTESASTIFWDNDAVELVHGSLSGVDMEGSGLAVARDVTDSGIELIMLRSSDIGTLDTKYRITAWAAPNILVPEKCGIIVNY